MHIGDIYDVRYRSTLIVIRCIVTRLEMEETGLYRIVSFDGFGEEMFNDDEMEAVSVGQYKHNCH